MKKAPTTLTGMSPTPYTTSENYHFPEVPPPSPGQAAPNLPIIIPPTDAAHELSQLAEQACQYYDYQLAKSTVDVYERDWLGYQTWCNTYGLDPLPAGATTIALYITWMAQQERKPSTIQRHLAAIKAKHVEKGYQAPTQETAVKRIMHGISRQHNSPPEGAKALLPETLDKLLHVIDPSSLIGKRDRALLLIGFAGAFRRSELIGLDIDDIEWHDEGMIALLRHSKTDQQRKGRLVAIPYGKYPATCPVVALKAWLLAAGIKEGAIFRGMNCQGSMISKRLSGRAVSLIIKRHVIAVGLDAIRYSGHSLRAGHCTAAARAGISEGLIMQQTGHKSRQTLCKYIRLGKLFHENSALYINV